MCRVNKPLVLLAGVLCHSMLQAQIITDGLMGPQVTLDAPDVQIDESLGTRSGAGLFHSFQTFNIAPGGSATFTGAADIDHVVSRVTGGEVSAIQGLLRSEIGNADFYLINPAGVVVASGGSINVPASFHLSTADELRFTDGQSVTTTTSPSSVLSLGVPEQFGFLGEGSGSIQVLGGNVFVDGGEDATTTLSLTASNLYFENAGVNTGGNLYMVAVADGVSRVDIASGASTGSGGEIIVSDTLIGAGPQGLPDNIRVQAGSLGIREESELTGLVSESTGTLVIEVSSLDLNRGLIGSRGGVDIEVAEQLTITDAGVISSSNANSPQDIARANSRFEFSPARYADILAQDTQSDSGDINITAGELLIEGRVSSITGITSQSGIDAPGSAGNINVNVGGTATIRNNGQISSVTEGDGPSGDITFAAGELMLEHTDVGESAGIYSETFAGGDAGDVNMVVTDNASISGRVSSSTFSDGDAGNIVFSANSMLLRQISEDQTGIFSDTEGAGAAGVVDVNVVEDANLVIGGRISTTTTGAGAGGLVRLTAGELFIDGARDVTTGIFSRAFDFVENTGDAGDISVTVAGTVTIQDGGQISTDTHGAGNAGSISVNAGELVIRHDGGADELLDETGIFSESAGLPFRQPPVVPGGDAGNIEININRMASIQNGGQISSSNEGTGAAGSVVLKSPAGAILLSDGSEIGSASIQLNSNSGNIDIETGGSLTVDRSTISTQSQGGLARPVTLSAGILNTRSSQITTTTNSATADGGNISLQSEVFVIRETIIQANADSGSGGEIVVNSSALVPFANQLSTNLTQRVNIDDPQTAVAGNIMQAVAENGVTIPPQLNTPELDVSAAVTSIESNLNSAPTVAGDPCAGAQSMGPSTLVSAGRGSLPQVVLVVLPPTPTMRSSAMKDSSEFEHKRLADNAIMQQLYSAGCG